MEHYVVLKLASAIEIIYDILALITKNINEELYGLLDV
jgi:hypothetical protein